ncbi:MAG: hypothetical protein H6Q15_892 [Bacteroidetes bacterium]|nr:hypothetical protein [Bacteroidota bacterium]
MKKIWKGLGLWLKITIITVLSIIVIVLAIHFSISSIAKNYIEKHDKELVGRKIRISDLKVNIFTGSLDISKFSLYEKDDTSEFVSFDSLNFKMRLLPLINSKIIVDRIYLLGAKANILQSEKGFNFDDIMQKFSDTTSSDTTSSSWDITLNNIEISKTDIYYKDLALGATWNLKDMALTIPSLYLSDKSSDVGIKLMFENGGSLAMKAKYNMESAAYRLDIDLKDLSINNILPYAQQFMNINKIEGLLSANLDIIGDVDHVMDFDLKGNISARDFYMNDNKDRNVLSISSLSTDIDNISLVKNSYLLKKLLISGFKTSFDMNKDGTNNFSSLMKPSSEDTTTTNEPKMKFIIGDFIVDNSSLIFKDKTLQKPLTYNISNIAINSKNLKLEGENNFDLSAKIGTAGNVSLKWKGNMDDMSNQEIRLNIINAELRDFTPYSLEYFAYPFNGGNLSFKSQNIIKNNNLNGTNKLDIYKCRFGKKDKTLKAEYSNIPIKVGLYIIEDRKNRIKLDIPVKGNVNSPEFSYWKIALKTLGNLLVKVATSPFDALGKSLGISAGEMEYMNINPMQSEFNPEQFSKMQSIADMSKSKPELKITMTLELNYNERIAQYSINYLKQAYFFYKNPSRVGTELSTTDNDQISNTRTDSPEFEAFVNSVLVSKSLPLSGSIEEKASSIYGVQAEGDLMQSIQTLNARVQKHFTEVLLLPQGQINIIPMPIEEMKKYKDPNRYHISIGEME